MNFGFQRKTDLALHVLRRLGTPGAKLSGASLSSSIGTTTAFLPQVVSPLIERGWIVSERGPGGGYALTDSSLDISVFDVLEATEGPTVDGRCVLRDQPCPGAEACLAHAVWSDAREALINGFQSIPAIPRQGELI
jgi:Rrf2 family protein